MEHWERTRQNIIYYYGETYCERIFELAGAAVRKMMRSGWYNNEHMLASEGGRENVVCDAAAHICWRCPPPVTDEDTFQKGVSEGLKDFYQHYNVNYLRQDRRYDNVYLPSLSEFENVVTVTSGAYSSALTWDEVENVHVGFLDPRERLRETLTGFFGASTPHVTAIGELSEGELEALVAYADSGSYSRAAMALGRSEGSVSKSVRRAREKLGVL